MGAIIINDTRVPGKTPNRQLNTPEGNLDDFNKRITEYLEKIRSKATTASIFAVRDATLAGLPPPRST